MSVLTTCHRTPVRYYLWMIPLVGDSTHKVELRYHCPLYSPNVSTKFLHRTHPTHVHCKLARDHWQWEIQPHPSPVMHLGWYSFCCDHTRYTQGQICHCFLLSVSHILHIRHCPACRTTLVATRFRVALICPIIQVPHCIRVFFYFVWFVFINHIFQFYYELCTYCNILDIYLS